VRSIQSLIFIRLFCINIIFFALVSVFTYFLTSEAIKQFAISDASTSLFFIVNNIEGNYKSELTAIDQIASLPGFLPFDEKTAQGIIKEFLELPNIFTTVHLYRADGQLVFAERRLSYDSRPYKPKTNFHQKEPQFVALAQKAIEEKRSLSSEAFFTWEGVPYQTYITPVFDNAAKQHVIGILSGGVFPRRKKIEYLLQGLKLGDDNFILLTDSRGNFITSDGINEKDASNSTKQHTDEAAQHFFRKAGADAHQVFVKQRLLLGQSSFILMSLPIPDLNLVVTLGFNTRPIDQKTRELSNRLFFGLVVGFLLSLFASIFVGERLSRPFREIAHTVDEINIGNFSARTKYKGNDEIGYLSTRINNLAEKIEKSKYLGNLWSNEEELEEQIEIRKESKSETRESE
jgi:HAMP domain-containing protein